MYVLGCILCRDRNKAQSRTHTHTNTHTHTHIQTSLTYLGTHMAAENASPCHICVCMYAHVHSTSLYRSGQNSHTKKNRIPHTHSPGRKGVQQRSQQHLNTNISSSVWPPQVLCCGLCLHIRWSYNQTHPWNSLAQLHSGFHFHQMSVYVCLCLYALYVRKNYL